MVKKNLESKMGKWDWKKEIESNIYMSEVQKGIIRDLHDSSYEPFKLDKSFINKYSKMKAPFGFGGFGELVFMKSYSRIKEDGTNEQWYDTIERVVNGTYNIQKRHIEREGLGWDDHKAQESAQEMYGRMYSMKFLPPGRGIWAMGSEITEERGLYAALNNCGFTSTENIGLENSGSFRFLMDMSMLGVGVGSDMEGAGKALVVGPDRRRTPEVFVVPDTREGWVESVGLQIDSYLKGTNVINFKYHLLRKEGLEIKGFGGKSSGAQPLVDLHMHIDEVLSRRIGKPMDSRNIGDIDNLIGQCVVSGNIRRSAEILLGCHDDEEFLDLKNYGLNPERSGFGWVSNNSINAPLGMDYGPAADRIAINGEPGFVWMENARDFGRMMDSKNYKDAKAKGVNPCVEQTLFDKELCTLVETFPNNHENIDDYQRTLKFAYLYAKTVTLGKTHNEDTNRVMLKNRRIGTSMSGIQQFVSENGISTLRDWAMKGYDTIQKYDDIYSEWMAVRPSIKTTSVKPSGTVSLLAGSTPGMHWPISRYAIRRMRLSKTSDLVSPLIDAGYTMADDVADKSSYVIEAAIDFGPGIRGESEVPMREQLEMAATLQNYWADNQVSSTIKFHPGLTTNRKILDYEIKELSLLEDKKARTDIDNQRLSDLKSLEFRSGMHQKEELRILRERLSSGEAGTLERIVELEVKIARSETDQIEKALDDYQYRLKGISLLPINDEIYEQAPFEAIDEATFKERSRGLKSINFNGIGGQKNEMERGCTNDVCELKSVKA